MTEVSLAAVVEGARVWLAGNKDTWGLYEVVSRNGKVAKLKPEAGGKSHTMELTRETRGLMYLANPVVEADMTNLKHFHVPGILSNIKERAEADEPYTFMSQSVLVAVNPLRDVPDPEGILGAASAVNVPHPYAIAESAYQQLVFGLRRADEDSETPVDQSIIIGGESGSGKTTSAKMVLKHLTMRTSPPKSKSAGPGLDERLLESNPILEAFGNAVTSRNHNSSRFGKFMKLHFAVGKTKKKSKRKAGELNIFGASVKTYLLERSRVTFHVRGERTYHVFYQLVHGADADLRRRLHLDGVEFEYLAAREPSTGHGVAAVGKKAKRMLTGAGAGKKKDRSLPTADFDAANFQELVTALATIGLGDEDNLDQEDDGANPADGPADVFAVVAAILHMGNIVFQDEDSPQGSVAAVVDEAPLHTAAGLLGVDADGLRRGFTEVSVKTVGELIVKQRDARGAKFSLDAVAKTLYVGLFEWLVHRITVSLSSGGEMEELPFIGVLDIFGFETFEVNDFEQLLINYTNEALQSCFSEQIFQSEAALYEREGLLVAADERELPVDNAACVDLLEGGQACVGILPTIDAEAKAPGADDERLNATLHREFRAHANFAKVHPRDARSCFTVKHYAGDVKYTVGSFLEKNSDALPPEVAEVFAASSSALVRGAFRAAVGGETKKKKSKKKKKNVSHSVTAKFRKQMRTLIGELNTTRCSFVRCVKPNASMARSGHGEWLDNAYIIPQLQHLSIPQTAQVLKGGLPTRVEFSVFHEIYADLMPRDAMAVVEEFDATPRQFVDALFYAYEIDPASYKIGRTKVFFKAGMLDRVNEVLQGAVAGDLSDEVVERFKESFSREMWRRVRAKLRMLGLLAMALQDVRDRLANAARLKKEAEKKRKEMEMQREIRRERERRITELIKTASNEVSESKRVLRELAKELETAESPEEAAKLEEEMDRIRVRMERAESNAKRMSLSLNRSRRSDATARRSARMSLARAVSTDRDSVASRMSLASRMSFAAGRRRRSSFCGGDDRKVFRKSVARDFAPPPEDESDEPLIIDEGLEILIARSKPSAISRLICLGSRRGNGSNGADNNAELWYECKLHFVGFQMRFTWWEQPNATTSDDPTMGNVQINSNVVLESDTKAEDANVYIIRRKLGGLDFFGREATKEVFRLRFADDENLREFGARFTAAEEALADHDKQAQNLFRGHFVKKDGTIDDEKNATARELRQLFDAGLISGDEYQMGLFLQISSQDEHLHRYVTVFGTDAYQDYKIQCPSCMEILFNLPDDRLEECPKCGFDELDTPEDLDSEAALARDKEASAREKLFKGMDFAAQDDFPFCVVTSDKQQFMFETPTLSEHVDRSTLASTVVFNMQWIRRFKGEADWQRFVMSHTWAEYRDFFSTEVYNIEAISSQARQDIPDFDMQPNDDDEMLEDLHVYMLGFLRAVYAHDLLRIPQVTKFFGYTRPGALVEDVRRNQDEFDRDSEDDDDYEDDE